MPVIQIGSAGPNNEVKWTVSINPQNQVEWLECDNRGQFDAYGAVLNADGSIRVEGVFHPNAAGSPTHIGIPQGQQRNWVVAIDPTSGSWDIGDKIVQYPYQP